VAGEGAATGAELDVGHGTVWVNGDIRYIAMQFSRLEAFLRAGLTDSGDNKLDLGFLTGPTKFKTISHHVIHTAPYVVVMPINHPLSELEEIPLSLLAEEDFVIGDSVNWQHFIPQLNAYCIEAGFIPKISRQAPNTESIFGLVAAKMGLTLYPDFGLNHNRQDIAIRPVENNNVHMKLEAAWHKNSTNPTVSLFLTSNEIPLI
jgi:DNA-binding transcriptional LysR family regulator